MIEPFTTHSGPRPTASQPRPDAVTATASTASPPRRGTRSQTGRGRDQKTGAPRPTRSRYPIANLTRAAQLPTPALAEALGVCERTIQRATTNGLTETQADTWACRLGYPTAWIWGDLWRLTAPLDDE